MRDRKDFKERLSKTLAFILRHHPEEFGLTLDKQGMVNIEQLFEALHKHKHWELVKEDLDALVKDDQVQRFRYDEDELRVGANYGHSIKDMENFFEKVIPPILLYYGTMKSNVPQIFKNGLIAKDRNFVHLSDSLKQALLIGRRREMHPAIFKVLASNAHKAGILFYKTPNNIYLVKSIPPQYLTIEPQGVRGRRRW